MSNIHNATGRNGLDDEDVWIGQPAPQQAPAWLRNGMSRNITRRELITTLKRGRNR